MAKRPTTIDRHRTIFNEAAEIIETDYPRKLDLELVAERVSTSTRQLQRCFSEVGRTSFRSYLTEVRMRHARSLLMEKRKSVKEVASRVGYDSPVQFAKAFRRQYGAPPSSLEGRRPAAR